MTAPRARVRRNARITSLPASEIVPGGILELEAGDLVVAHPHLQGLRRFMLATRDAHGLCAKSGFVAPAKPEALMEIVKPGLYY